MRTEIEKVLESNVSAYAISKATGVSTSIILDLRNKKRKLDNLSLYNAERLEKFYYEKIYEDKHRIDELQELKNLLKEDFVIDQSIDTRNDLQKLKDLTKSLYTADGQPCIIVYDSKKEMINELKQNGDSFVDWDLYAEENLSDFNSDELVIKVLWTTGVPEYFHEYEIKEII